MNKLGIKKIQNKVELEVYEQGCLDDCITPIRAVGKTMDLVGKASDYMCKLTNRSPKGNIFW